MPLISPEWFLGLPLAILLAWWRLEMYPTVCTYVGARRFTWILAGISIVQIEVVVAVVIRSQALPWIGVSEHVAPAVAIFSIGLQTTMFLVVGACAISWLFVEDYAPGEIKRGNYTAQV
jgi:hypothetical protein